MSNSLRKIEYYGIYFCDQKDEYQDTVFRILKMGQKSADRI